VSDDLRALILINGLGTGGAERSLAEMLPEMAARGVVSTVVAFHRREEGVQDQLLGSDIDVRIIPTGFGGRIRAVRRLIHELRPDLVHTQLFEANMAGRLGALRSGAPVLTSLVNTNYDPVRIAADPNVDRWKIETVRRVDGFTARHLTAHFHAISHAVKDAAVRALRIDPARITIVERGRDPRRLGLPGTDRRNSVRARLGIETDRPVLIGVGREEHQKGFRHLVAAVDELRRTVPDVLVLLAGRRGHASAGIDRQIDTLGLGGHIRRLGHRDDVPDLLAAADVFVLSSLFEGIAGVVIEAMGLGLPIVATDIPAMREILEPGRNAELVPPMDAAAIATAAHRLLGEPSRRLDYGRRSREIFEARFTLDRIVERMVMLYRSVAEQGRSRG